MEPDPVRAVRPGDRGLRVGRRPHTSIAGATVPWPGGYGFFAAGAIGKDQIVMSTWVINLPASSDADSNWVEVFTRPIAMP